MKPCPRCRTVNADSATQCDCGYSFVSHSGGTAPVPMSARPMPLVVKVHALLVVGLLVLNLWPISGGTVSRRYRVSSEDQVVAVVIGVLLVAGLFFLMLRGKAWARVVLGIVTLPAGLLILLPRSARAFTEAQYVPDALQS
jgi:hypothetical protein